MKRIKVTAVSYLNTKPFLYGVFKSRIAQQIDLQLDIPSECARKLQAGEADLGLVPVAVIPELDSPLIISDFCIGTVGAVRTVGLFADLPLPRLKKIYLDYHSRTSVRLLEILLRDYWQLQPQLIPARPGFMDDIGGETGGLVIGDRAIELEQRFPYHYDLGAAWYDHTGLPFVFAAWVSNRALPAGFVNQFNLALQRGVAEIPQLIYLLPAPATGFDLKAYFTHHISYELDSAKRQALKYFLEQIGPQPFPSLEQSLLLSP